MASEPTPKPLNDPEFDASPEAQTLNAQTRHAPIHKTEAGIQQRSLGEVLPSGDSKREPGSNSPLNEVAESVGGTLGRAVGQAQRIAKEAERAAARWTARARDTGANEERGVADKFAQAKQSVASAGHEAKQWAGELAQRTRSRARQLANEYPLQTIAVSTGAAFLIGILLRIRRSNGYECE